MLLIILLGILLVLSIILLKHKNYWENKNVPFIKTWPIIGNIGPFVFGQMSLAEIVVHFYNKFPNKRYIGIYQFTKPTLIITDVDLIKQLAIKDFDHFVDRRTFVSEQIDPLFGKSLFSLTGQKWKNMRSTLSPAFTSSKMRSMFILMNEMTDQLLVHLSKNVPDEKTVTFEVKDLFSRFANDVIATSAFGIQCDSLEERNNEFFLMGQNTIFDGFIDGFKLFAYTLNPSLMKLFNVRLFSEKVSNFFSDIVITTMKVREENGILRPDMIHLLMEARKGALKAINSSENNKEKTINLTDEDISAQALFFFFAGFETTSTLLCHMANELAQNVNIQIRLQNEIDDAIEKFGKKINYETLMEMKYLDMVVSETLRKWPTVPVVDRKCVKSYTIEPNNNTEQSIIIEKDDFIWFPIFALHRDPTLFPDPDKFDPERFNSENKNNIKQFSYLPFGLGPRNCIGARFALMEAKIAYFYILSKFNIVVVKKTDIPLKLRRFQFNIQAENGFWVGLQRRIRK